MRHPGDADAVNCSLFYKYNRRFCGDADADAVRVSVTSVSDCCIVALPPTHFKPIQVDTMRTAQINKG